MAEKRTLARPYAKAIFELAFEDKNFEEWTRMLKMLTFIAQHAQVKRFISDASQLDEKQAEFFIQIAGSSLNEYGKNLIRILAKRRRLTILAEIEALYDSFRDQAENVVEAVCMTAVPLSEDQKNKFIVDLSQQFKRKVQMTFKTENSLIGGYLIKAGDTVIDGSVRGQLNKLKEQMFGG